MSIINSCCNACGEGSLTQKSRIRDISYKNTVLHIREDFLKCDVCGVQPSITSMIKDHRRAVLAAKRVYDGLLSAEEIKQIRRDLDLDQLEAYRLFGGGPTAFSKYENNDVMQSEAMDTLLRLSHINRSTFSDLKVIRSLQSSLKRKKLKVITNNEYSAPYDSIESSQDISQYNKHDLRFISVSEIQQDNTFTRIAV